MPFTMSLIVGMMISPNSIPMDSSWLFSMVSSPFRLSFMVSAMLFAAPELPSIAFVKRSKSASDAFRIAAHPEIAFFPKMALSAAACSDSDKSPSFSRTVSMISRSESMLPSESVVTMLYFFRASAAAFGGAARRVRPARSAVPAFDAFTLAFAIKPVAIAMSSMEIPMVPASGAAYWNVSPIISTFVFAFADAAAIISASLPASSALSPNAVKESVTMSDVVARSAPDAAARSITPSMPFSMSSVFQPAMAMNSNADAASVAE